MEASPGGYSVYNLNLVVTAKNHAAVTTRLDEYSATTETISDALALLKALFVGPNDPLMMATTTKLIPLKDYILSGFDRQFDNALNEQLLYLSSQGGLEKAFRENSVLFNEQSLEWFDIVMPSLLTTEDRRTPGVEFYILPIKMVSPDMTDRTILAISSLFEQEAEIKNVMAAFKSTDFYQELVTRSGFTLSLTPLIGDKALAALRGIVTKIRRIQGAKSGENY